MGNSERLYYLWQQYAENRATEAELDELSDWLNNPSYDETVRQHLLEQLQQTFPIGNHSESRLQRVLQQIGKQDETDRILIPYRKSQADARAINQKRTWFAAAAVLILIIGATWLINLTRTEKTEVIVGKNQSRLSNDLNPGGNKATLTLADGSEILLDSAANGALAQQGSTDIIKLANGEIVYTTKGNSNNEVLMNTMRTPRGGQYKLKLPDGTDVWLNSASSITYPTAFANEHRNVTITGEAYFEVAKDKSRPFYVKVKAQSASQKDMEVEVLGTHFNINAYDDEASIKTTLLEGSVHIISGEENGVLKPGQQAVVSSASEQKKSNKNITIVNHANVEEAVAWKEGYFQFNRADIKTVMRQISRWYDVEVQYEGAIPSDKFVGDLPMDAKASQVLRALEKVQVHFRIDGKRIIVTP